MLSISQTSYLQSVDILKKKKKFIHIQRYNHVQGQFQKLRFMSIYTPSDDLEWLHVMTGYYMQTKSIGSEANVYLLNRCVCGAVMI